MTMESERKILAAYLGTRCSVVKLRPARIVVVSADRRLQLDGGPPSESIMNE